MVGEVTGGWAWMWGVGCLFMLLLWAAIVLGVVGVASRALSTGNLADSGDRRPLDVLKERCAQSEITHDQYERMRRDLES